MPAGRGGRGGGVGYSNNFYEGKSYAGINETLYIVSICMAGLIALLITLALLYILRERLKERDERAYYVTA